MTLMRTAALTLVFLAALGPMAASAQHIDYAVRATVSAGLDGPHDLELAGGRAEDYLFLSLAPRAIIEFSPEWTGYVRGRIFVPTRRVAPFDSAEADDPRATGSYAGINELWIQYGGFTSYPGEALRIGRQHIRQTDSTWWDQDADALRWILDTTLVDAEVGAARAYSMFRTDDAEVPVAQRDRTYYFAHVAGDWRAENRLGLRAAHVTGGEQPAFASDPALADATAQDARLTWVGVYADNGFYDILRADRAIAYAGEVSYLIGDQQIVSSGAETSVSQDVRAWQGSLDLRWRPRPQMPLQIGGGYTFSEGGESGGRSHQFRQTGMQSNSSYFTGTKTLIGRYNETLQAQLGNLLVARAFVSLNLENDDASLIFARFRRDDGRAPIFTNNVTALPVNESRDIGWGVDLVITHYFAREQRRQRLLDRGDAFTAPQRRSLISLRASLFEPGEAYGPAARTDYRVLLEGTLWID
jgi:alginate production protein